MKKIILIILTLTLIISAATVVVSAASLGSGAATVANDVNLIKTGLTGKSLSFSDTDFKAALGVQSFSKLTVVTVPEADEGVLTLGEKKVSEGQQIRRRNISSLTFTPASDDISEVSFTFTVDELAGGAELECVMKFIDKINYAPKIDTDAADTLSVTTQRGISVYGNLSATDPEGDAIDYIIVSYPDDGTLTLCDSSSGEFVYTPSADYSGKDSFVYVARDEYGNYSDAEEVNIRVIERMSEVVYADMEDSKSYNAAVAMTAMGIMSGKRMGDDMYFLPEEGVTRAEFVAMAMKCLGVKADTTLKETFFDDNDEIPKAYLGYVATAQRCGIVNGAFDGEGLKFRPNDAITKYEAAIVMSALIGAVTDESASVSFDNMYSIPVWARSEVGAMYELGIFDREDASGAKDPLCREEVAEYLYRLSNKKGV